jgi:hypothetical protein
MTENNVFGLTDIIPKQEIIQNQTPDKILSTIEKIINTVSRFSDKAKDFKSLYGREPNTKQEFKTGKPNPLNEYVKPPVQKIQQNPVSIKINTNLLNTVIDKNIEKLLKIADAKKDLKVSELVSLFEQYKGFLVPKLEKEIQKIIKDVVIIE